MEQKNNRVYPKVANFDDQIISKATVLFDVFTFEAHFAHGELSEAHPECWLNDHHFALVNGTVSVDGEPALPTADRAILPHQELRVHTIALPKETVMFGSMEGAALLLETKAVAVLAVKLDDASEVETYTLIVSSNGEPVYFNGQKIDQLQREMTIGDRLILGGVSIERRPKQFKVTDLWGRALVMDPYQLFEVQYQAEVPADFPEYRRSPRILRVAPTEKVAIQQPEALPQEAKSELMRTVLPPLTMIGASILSSLLTKGNPMMILGMGSASVLTTAIAISSYFTNKKETKQAIKDRQETYEAYLLTKQAELNKLEQAQRQALAHHFPSMDTLAQMAVTYCSRIYEKTTNNEDFLEVAFGLGDAETSYSIEFETNEQTADPLLRWAQDEVIHQRRLLKNAPIATKLLGQTLGFAGSYPVLRTAVSTLLFQVALFHSYRDVEFLALVPEEHYEEDWAKWRWLPHVQIRSLNLRGLVHNAQTRDMVLNSFYQLLSKRRQALREAGQDKPVFSPQYVLAILDDSYLAGHGLNEFLAEDMSQYGVTVVWCKEAPSMLPETVTTMVQYLSSEAAELINENNVYVAKRFQPYHLPKKISLETAIERLANLRHVEVEKNAIPKAITFLDMYNVKKVEELGTEHLWAKANAAKTLAVPLGLRGKDDIVALNLHERAHGPHGLVAGTTGSGKSEIIQSYILSLAIHFAPEDVGFLPIDFKGGGMANEFTGLPHLLGSITNLDGASSARALASIRAELQKRQRMFAKFGVNHINGYTKLYKKGKEITDPAEKEGYPAIPIPHLFLISDEFAELKANQPDFMAELVSVARIGRSLGVHLILATQKPSGVVDDQIWSNSRFKLALKVADEADSNEILKTPDAASIVEPGRAYLQVGNNEIYELFQSAWSGATYDPHAVHEEKIDDRVWLINDLGQYQLLSTDLSDEDDQPAIASEEEKVTQLRAVVDYLAEMAETTQAILPEKPWLPPLGEHLASPVLKAESEWRNDRDLKIPLAKMDIPSRQAQEDFLFDVEETSHTAIYGSAGFGKSTLLQTLVMNLARKNTPEQVQFNLLDFGTNGLLPLKDLPHVTDLVRLDELEKLQKMLGMIRAQLDERKQQFQQVGVASLEQYEQRTQTKLAVILNILDGYDALSESELRDTIDPVLTQILREGSSLGIYLILTANRSSSLRMAMTSNLPTKIVMYMVDEDELTAIIGRDRLVQQDIQGRIQLQLDEVLAMQVYLPNAEKTSLGILSKITQEIEEMNTAWQGEKPESLPIVAAEFDLDEFNACEEVQKWQETGNIPLGRALKDTQPLGYLIEKHPFFILSYTMEEQLMNQQLLLLNQLTSQKDRYKLYMTDFEQEYSGMHETFHQVFKDDLLDTGTVQELLMSYVTAAKSGESKEPAIVYISDLEDFSKKVMLMESDLIAILTKAYKAGLHVIVQAPDSYWGTFSTSGQTVKGIAKAGIVSARVTDTSLLQSMGSSMEPQLLNNEAYYFEAQGRKFEKIRFAGEV